MLQQELIAQCAESEVIACQFHGQAAVLKRRPKKAYRHPTLDSKIREGRTVREARALVRAKKAGVPTPAVYLVNKAECSIVIERMQGPTVRDIIAAADSSSPLPHQLLEAMGEIIAKLHSTDQIHGDLTTSNFMLRDVNVPESLVVIDFGLVRQSTDAEERAVDLYVLERAIGSTHPLLPRPMEALWRGYSSGQLSSQKVAQTLQRLEMVRARGRKRSMIG
jgi:TP53 regulating kinase and related kinases